jgi:hypothetical protein
VIIGSVRRCEEVIVGSLDLFNREMSLRLLKNNLELEFFALPHIGDLLKVTEVPGHPIWIGLDLFLKSENNVGIAGHGINSQGDIAPSQKVSRFASESLRGTHGARVRFMFLDLGSLSSGGMSALVAHHVVTFHTVLKTQYPGNILRAIP